MSPAPVGGMSAPRAIRTDDLAALLKLNNDHATELSDLDLQELARLVEVAFLARTADGASCLLLAFDQDAAYASPNFLWFRERMDRFVYVDRIVIAVEARGRGLARALYAELFAAARLSGHEQIVCEVNVAPPNPGSDAFHARLEFQEVGRALLPERGKSVRYLARRL